MELSTFKYSIKNDAFKVHVLTDKISKRVQQEFEFYNIRFYREERAKDLTLCLDYPKANVYWFLEFKKFILKEDAAYQGAWEHYFEMLKREITRDYEFKLNNLKNVSTDIPSIMDCMYKYDLRPYQAYDLLCLQEILKENTPHTALILSEQRTGKTRVALASSIMNLDVDDICLIICPKTAMGSWIDEIKHLNELSGTSLNFNIIQKMTDIKNMSFFNHSINYVIISYDLLKRLSKLQLKNLLQLPKRIGRMVIGDEIHRLRNFKTLQSKAMFMLKEVMEDYSPYLLGLTGTPAIKDTYDIFGILSFINSSKIGFHPTQREFNLFKEYFYNCEDTSYGKVCKSLKKKAELNYIIKCNAIQTKQSDLNLFKNYNRVYKKIELDMDEEQKKIYTEVDETFEYEDIIDCKNKLVQYQKLQQICNDPLVLVPSYEGLAPKVKYIVKFAEKNKGMKFIIMSKRLKALKNLEKVLGDYGITYTTLSGEMTLKSRIDNVKIFKETNTQVFIIQSDAGREALTLPEAKCIIFLDRDFAQGFNEQAEARMTPFDGKPVTKYIIDLVMKGTIEERIYDLLVTRKESINDINTIFKKEKKED